MNWLLLLLTFCGLSSYSTCHNILGLFPHPGISHFHFFHPILRGLAEAGHNVTVVSHFPDKNPPENYTDLVLPPTDLLVNILDLKYLEKRFYTSAHIFQSLYEAGVKTCRHFLQSDALDNILSGHTKYDVVLVEQFNTDCLMSIPHILNVPAVALSSCALLPWHYERMGNPIIPSYIPSLFLGKAENMDFPHRVLNWFLYHGYNYFYDRYNHKVATDLVRERFGQHMPSTKELAMNTSIFLVNQHFSLSGVKPLSPAVIEVGGVHIQGRVEPLDKKFQDFLDSAEHGVVVFSWGSMIRSESLAYEKVNALLSAFKRLKQKVIWKWENETMPNKPPNVLISKWLPQKDILRHPNVKVFMTHGGLLGSTEAVYCGLPVVVTPMFADQHHNAATLVERGMGTILYLKDITENNVYNALTTVLDKKYLENAKAVSRSFRKRPKSPLETAIWWVEYVIELKGAPLTKSISSQMSTFTYYSLDVYTLFIVLLVILSFVCRWIFNLGKRMLARLEKVKTL